jgi:hypothetical protein
MIMRALAVVVTEASRADAFWFPEREASARAPTFV